jgi:hypothetical protein
MSLLNYVFKFVEIAEIYLPKEQYNASMLIQSLKPLGMVFKFNYKPLFGFIKIF